MTREWKLDQSVDQLVVHFEMTGDMIAKESAEADI